MADNVVRLQIGLTRQVWVCGCGCTSFELEVTGRAVCASCGTPVETGSEGGWFHPEPDAGEYVGAAAPFNDLQGVDDSFALRLFLDRWRTRLERLRERHEREKAGEPMAPDGDDAVVLAMVRRDGSTTLWKEDGLLDGPERVAWARRRLRELLRLVRL